MHEPVVIKSIPAASLAGDAARALLTAARDAAAERGVRATVAIVDAGGHLKAFDRADGAPFLTADVAVDKAWTAASFGIATLAWNGYVRDPDVAPLAGYPRLVAVGGGCPIHDAGALLGGIGISGGNVLQDHEIAEAALQRCGFGVAP